jgi:hypothetical protein
MVDLPSFSINIRHKDFLLFVKNNTSVCRSNIKSPIARGGA